MSNQIFNPVGGPILTEAEVTGPARSSNLKLLLDTGATRSLIDLSMLIYLGIDPGQSSQHVQMTTGSSVEIVPLVMLTRLGALGQNRIGFPVIAHALPENSAVDGLLGLDFLRGHLLSIDFRASWINLA